MPRFAARVLREGSFYGAVFVLVTFAAFPPHVAFLGRIPGTMSYSDLARHPENAPLAHVVAFRPEASLLYVNADSVLESLSRRLEAEAARDIPPARLRPLGVTPYGSRGRTHAAPGAPRPCAPGIALRIVGARGWVRDLLRAEGIDEKIGGLDRLVTLDDLLGGARR